MNNPDYDPMLDDMDDASSIAAAASQDVPVQAPADSLT